MNQDSKNKSSTGQILLAHGSGGELSHELVASLFVKKFHNPFLTPLDDSAVLPLEGTKWVFTTDSYVVTPIFFPGGDIGRLAVCGTVNDLAMSGARPFYLSAGFIIEEGFSLSSLEKIVQSMEETAAEAGVKIVTGDTKVVNRGGADKIFIHTSGIGLIPREVQISADQARLGDKILLSGTIGDHGVAILSVREGLEFSTALKSDCAPLNGLVATMIGVSPKIHCLLLGLEPWILANEGKLVAVVAPEVAELRLQEMKMHPLGLEAGLIGEVRREPRGKVVLRTSIGSTRILDRMVGEPLPRIC